MDRSIFEKELRAKSDEIAQLNKQIAATVTGGDSYCALFVSRPAESSRLSDLILMNQGKYPVYDVSIKIDDVERMLDIVKSAVPTAARIADLTAVASKVINVGNIGPSQASEVGRLQLPNGVDRQSYNVYITARNGSVMQAIRLRKVGGQWKMAVRTDVNGVVKEETADPEFPRNERGVVQW